MQIEFYGLYGTLLWERDEIGLFANLRQAFSILDPGRIFSPAFKRGFTDGRIHMISKDGRFLRGLATEMIAKITELGGRVDGYVPYNQEWKALNAPLVPLAESLSLEGVQLAPHQRRMTRALLEAGGGTVEGVTGAGKTESMTLLARILLEHTQTVFFLVHRMGLMREARERTSLRCPQLANICGLLGDGERPKAGDRIIFSTVQSLASVLGLVKGRGKKPELAKLWKEAGAVIIDECHRADNASYLKVLSRGAEVPIYQFSGTPETDDPIKDWTICGVGGPIVARVKRSELEQIGFIAEAIACVREFNHRADEIPGSRRKRKIEWMPKSDDLSYEVDALRVDDNGDLIPERVRVDSLHGLQSERDEYYLYPTYGRDMLFLEPERNRDIAAFVHASLGAGRQPLLLCERVAQVYHLRKVLTGSGLDPALIGLIHGSHAASLREEIVSDFERGVKPVLIASSVFDEGEDIQEVGSVVLASGGASLVKVIQRIGRGVRAKGEGTGNWVPLWFSVDQLTKFSREHTIARVSYLQRAEISLEEVGTTPWEELFAHLQEKYGANPNRNTRARAA